MAVRKHGLSRPFDRVPCVLFILNNLTRLMYTIAGLKSVELSKTEDCLRRCIDFNRDSLAVVRQSDRRFDEWHARILLSTVNAT